MSKLQSALIERRYNSFTPSGQGVVVACGPVDALRYIVQPIPLVLKARLESST
jgi:hypothetical protein